MTRRASLPCKYGLGFSPDNRFVLFTTLDGLRAAYLPKERVTPSEAEGLRNGYANVAVLYEEPEHQRAVIEIEDLTQQPYPRFRVPLTDLL